MKSLIATALLIASSFSYAARIGDYAKHSYTDNVSGETKTWTLAQELIEYDSKSEKFKQRSTYVQDGKTTVYEKWVGGSLFYDDESAARDIENCEKDGGKIEPLKVPAGTLNTCHTTHAFGTYIKSDVWVAVVPFGEAKWDTTSSTGLKQTMTLLEYRFGAKN